MKRKLLAGIVVAAVVGAAAGLHRIIKPVPS
jgi:gas vesicle protein